MKAYPKLGRAGAYVLLMLLICTAALAACAKPGTQTVYLQFRPTGKPPTPSAFTVGVVPFEDMRTAPRSIGRHIRTDGSSEPIVVGSPSPSKDLTYMLIRYLEGRGITVVDLPSWRPDLDNLKGLPPGIQLAFAGRMDALEVEADSTLFKTTVRYRIHLTAHLGLVDRGEIVTRSWKLGPQRTSVRFSVREIEDELNRALTEALEGLLDGMLPGP